MTIEFEGNAPRIDPDAIVLEPSVICGDVEIGPHSSVWFGCVIRGDVGSVRIGARTNIQDGCVIHETRGMTDCVIEDDVTVGHRAVIHGAHLGRGCLIGMGAVVLDGASIGEGAMVGAGALVSQGMVVPPGQLAVGVPARVIRPLTDAEKNVLAVSAAHYVEYARKYGT
jgi:carbonic anhydrase/acetyltransferase-like protein (isoleucine patch superfamily)